jgi:hypothetical protein
MQILEGTQEQILALLDRIRHDSRHHELRIVAEGAIKRRAFPDWGMVWHGLDTEERVPDFASLQHRRIDLIELADDAQVCYDYITSCASYSHSRLDN